MGALDGKTALITGATSGIGLEAAVELARAGARTVIVGRSPERLAAALSEIRQRAASDPHGRASFGAERVGSAAPPGVEGLLCDFSSQAQIRQLAAEFLASHPRLELLINNAGSVWPRRQLTEDGIERTFAVNHLGYFLLTGLLLDTLVASAPARIVNVASGGHYAGTLDFDDLGFARGYGLLKAYTRSKLANVLFTRELARRLSGTGVTANAVHPGTVATGIWSHGSPRWAPFLRPLIGLVTRLTMISAAEGGRTLSYLALDPAVAGQSGLYFENHQPRPPARLALDDGLAARLWEISAELVGLAPAKA